MKAVFVRAKYGEYTEVFRKNNFAAIGWFDEPVSDYSVKETINEYYKKQWPEHSDGTRWQNLGQIYRFWNEINLGDIIITTYGDGQLLIGLAEGKPYFKKDNILDFYERINVKWKPEKFNRYTLSIPTQNTLKSSLTVFKVAQVREIAALAGINYIPGKDEPVIRTEVNAEENIYNSIKQKLLTLADDEFEIFVSYILQSLGFDASQRTGKVGDGGIDFEGILDVFGVATTKLQVQVKRYDSSVIGELQIRNFRGALKRDFQGTFITLSDFNKKAVESAKDENKIPINLLNGRKLIELFILQYDKVMELIEADENEELQKKLKFKKVIIPFN